MSRRVAQDESGDDGDDVGLEEVRGHTGTVTNVVTDVVSDGRGVTRVVFRNSRFDLADEVSTDVSGLGEDSTTDTHEQRQERGTEGEADEHRGGGVLEDKENTGGADEAKAHAEQTSYGTGAEGDLQCFVGTASANGSGGGTNVASNGGRHTNQTNEAREG